MDAGHLSSGPRACAAGISSSPPRCNDRHGDTVVFPVVFACISLLVTNDTFCVLTVQQAWGSGSFKRLWVKGLAPRMAILGGSRTFKKWGQWEHALKCETMPVSSLWSLVLHVSTFALPCTPMTICCLSTGPKQQGHRLPDPPKPAGRVKL